MDFMLNVTLRTKPVFCLKVVKEVLCNISLQKIEVVVRISVSVLSQTLDFMVSDVCLIRCLTYPVNGSFFFVLIILKTF
jgi:hypothetical protein